MDTLSFYINRHIVRLYFQFFVNTKTIFLNLNNNLTSEVYGLHITHLSISHHSAGVFLLQYNELTAVVSFIEKLLFSLD